MSSFSADRVALVAVVGGVGGAQQPVAVPLAQDDHRVLGLRQDSRRRVERLLADEQVHPLGRGDVERVRPGELLDLRRPHAGRVHDDPRRDVEGPAALHVVGRHAGGPAVGAGAHGRHLGVRDHLRPVGRRGPGHGQGVAGVVHAPVRVLQAGDDDVRVEPGRLPGHRLAAQVAGVRRPARPLAHRGHRVVEADARTHVRLLPLVLQRVEEVLVADQVRRERLDRQVAFAQRTEHQREVELLQVAQPAVHGLAGARGGADGEVAGLQQHHRQPAGGRVQGDAGTGDATTDHHQVVRPGGGGGDRVLAGRRGKRRSHFVSPCVSSPRVASALRECHSGLAASSSSIWWAKPAS